VTLAAADTVGRNFIPESMNLTASKPEFRNTRKRIDPKIGHHYRIFGNTISD
jgi:hypothetical protein